MTDKENNQSDNQTKSLNFKERLEKHMNNNIILWFLSTAITNFALGFIVYNFLIDNITEGKKPLFPFPSSNKNIGINIGDLPRILQGQNKDLTIGNIKKYIQESILINNLPNKLKNLSKDKIIKDIDELYQFQEALNDNNVLITYLEGKIPKYENQSINFVYTKDKLNDKKFDSKILQKILHKSNILISEPNNNLFCTASLLFQYSYYHPTLRRSDLIRNYEGYKKVQVTDLDSTLEYEFKLALLKQQTIIQIKKDITQGTPLQIECEIGDQKTKISDYLCGCEKTNPS